MRVSVTDSGPGIPEELQPALFERFVRGDSARSNAGTSTGLGLAIVQAVTTAHGGSVSVTSRPGHTSFVITLPRLTSGRRRAPEPAPLGVSPAFIGAAEERPRAGPAQPGNLRDMRSLECLVGQEFPQPEPDRLPQVEIVVPVRDEERDLEPGIRRLVAYLAERFPFRAVVTIADNGSTDGTWAAAQALAAELDGVGAVRLERPGRGHALRSTWSASRAEVLAYMDVDLSTDLNALLPLVAPLLSGHSDLAIGTRLARGARVVRGPRREVISRCYNVLLHATLGAGSPMPSAGSRRSAPTRRGCCCR